MRITDEDRELARDTLDLLGFDYDPWQVKVVSFVIASARQRPADKKPQPMAGALMCGAPSQSQPGLVCELWSGHAGYHRSGIVTWPRG
jgi:hypothetical protein